MDIDKVLTSLPIDRTAKQVMSPGFQYAPDKKTTRGHWEICPLLSTLPRKKNMPNLIGRRQESLVVIGVLAEARNERGKRNGKGKTRWGSTLRLWALRSTNIKSYSQLEEQRRLL